MVQSLKILKEKTIKYWMLLVFVAVMVLNLFPISDIGWLVHSEFIKKYGLVFSMDWAIRYWIDEMLVVLGLGLMGGLGYWIFRAETKKHRLTAVMLGLTVFWQWMGGFFDWIWFLLDWIGGYPLPALDKLWYWNPFYWFLGIHWTTLHHIVFTIIMESILFILWYLWYRRTTKNNENHNP